MDKSHLVSYVKADFKRENEDDRILQAINDMIMYISIRIPHGNYKFQSYANTIIGQEDYPLPDTILHLINPIRLLEGNATNDQGFVLDHITKEQYDEFEPNPNRTDPSTGKPHSYTVYSRSILLTPIPDKIYLLEINWAKKPTALSADTDIHSLGSEWDEIIKWGALFRCYAGLGLYDEAEFFRSKYEDGMNDPTGIFKILLESEREYEGHSIGQVINNNL